MRARLKRVSSALALELSVLRAGLCFSTRVGQNFVFTDLWMDLNFAFSFLSVKISPSSVNVFT